MCNKTAKKFFDNYGRCIKTIGGFTLYPPIVCKDGFFISVQASELHNCMPKETLEEFDYECVEVRCTELDDLLQMYSDKDSTICDMVPVDIIEALIAKHNGIDEDAVKRIIEEENSRDSII